MGSRRVYVRVVIEVLYRLIQYCGRWELKIKEHMTASQWTLLQSLLSTATMLYGLLNAQWSVDSSGSGNVKQSESEA